jgi:hypothetical protein
MQQNAGHITGQCHVSRSSHIDESRSGSRLSLILDLIHIRIQTMVFFMRMKNILGSKTVLQRTFRLKEKTPAQQRTLRTCIFYTIHDIMLIPPPPTSPSLYSRTVHLSKCLYYAYKGPDPLGARNNYMVYDHTRPPFLSIHNYQSSRSHNPL